MQFHVQCRRQSLMHIVNVLISIKLKVPKFNVNGLKIALKWHNKTYVHMESYQNIVGFETHIEANISV